MTNPLTDALIARERDKYRRMWEKAAYRQHSPGEAAANQFLYSCKWKRHDTILDAGCGTGRASIEFALAGLYPHLVDITANALDYEAHSLTFTECAIHEFKNRCTWIFCVDVLEHIPPPLLDATLDALQRCTIKGGYLQIASFPDHCGKLINEELHLIIQNPSWWAARIIKRWEIVEDRSDLSYARFVIGPPL